MEFVRGHTRPLNAFKSGIFFVRVRERARERERERARETRKSGRARKRARESEIGAESPLSKNLLELIP